MFRSGAGLHPEPTKKAPTAHQFSETTMQETNNIRTNVPNTQIAFPTFNREDFTGFACPSELHAEIGERNEIQHIQIGLVKGRDFDRGHQIAEDTNRCFDELFMLAIDEDLGFDQAKWIQKGYFAFFESTPVPTCEPVQPVRKLSNMPAACMASGSGIPPPTYRVRSRPCASNVVRN
jgi:hypothetical protein